MTGRTHYKIGILYFLLVCQLTTLLAIDLLSGIRLHPLGLLAAFLGALFPDADEDHSLINSRNPLFRLSNRTIHRINQNTKRMVGTLFFLIPALLLVVYMYRSRSFKKEYGLIMAVLLFLGFNSLKVGRWFPILSGIFQRLDQRAARIKSWIIAGAYLILGGVCIYYGYRGQNGYGYLWGGILILISRFPHRTFLHAPEGMILVTLGWRYMVEMLGFPWLTVPFMIGYCSHLYLADIFTNSGVPVTSLPILLKKSGLHESLKKYKGYRRIFKALNLRLRIPVMGTGSTWGKILEGMYLLSLVVAVIWIYGKK